MLRGKSKNHEKQYLSVGKGVSSRLGEELHSTPSNNPAVDQ